MWPRVCSLVIPVGNAGRGFKGADLHSKLFVWGVGCVCVCLSVCFPLLHEFLVNGRFVEQTHKYSGL